jgi:hypothetical protein
MTPVAAPVPGRFITRRRLGGVPAAASAREKPKKLLLSRREAAAVLGISLSHFQRHVQPYLRCVYCGHLRLYRPEDLEAWTEEHAVLPSGEA